MSVNDDTPLGERVGALERSVNEILIRLNSVAAEAPPARPSWQAAATVPARRGQARFASPFAGRSMEWWLARGGAVLTCIALILLYQYAIERNWITPVVRVMAGVLTGAALAVAASRLPRPVDQDSDDLVGLREVLLGAALSAWFVTTYAAAASYHLISFGAARLIIIALSVAGAWLALSERRAILGLLALGSGFAAPALLTQPTDTVPATVLYVGALTALGLIIYLMRGWQSVLWVTFVAFWWLAGQVTSSCCNIAVGSVGTGILIARISVTALIVLAGFAMLRVPTLRRGLMTTGSPLYSAPVTSLPTKSGLDRVAAAVGRFTGVPAQSDSFSVIVITVLSGMLSLLLISSAWAGVSGAVWGAASIMLALTAYRLAVSPGNREEELIHIELLAATVWSLAGLLWIAGALGNPMRVTGAALLFAASAHSLVTILASRNSRFRSVQRIAFATAACAIAIVLLWELVISGSPYRSRSFEFAFTLAELSTSGVCIWMWWNFRRPAEPRSFATLIGIAAFAALLLVDARVLGRLWQPLVTFSYAVAGTAMLGASRGRADAVTLRRLGGVTLLIVAFRLLMVDLARVETIWRVILFLVCGALFLITSYRLQSSSSQHSNEITS
ncbi:MAG: DUF2339 domain-containing protein [Gemmatimonadaceae bacterium]